MKQRNRILVVVLVVAVMGGLAWLTVARSRETFYPPGELVREENFGDYQVKIYRHSRDEKGFFERICNRLPSRLATLAERIRGDRPVAGFEILRHGRRVHWQYGYNFGIAEIESAGEVLGRDITGDGKPQIAVTDDLGRQGGGSLFIFECAAQCRQIAMVESLGTYPKLKDLDGDGIPELVVSDNEFYHWPVCRDGEPMPDVILRWQNGKYIAAKDLMLKPAPPADELNTKAARLRKSPEWESGLAPEALWTNALALMYGGHEALGWEFVEAAWKPGFPDKGDSSKEDIINYYLRGKLEKSIYWQDIKNQGVMTASRAGIK